MKTGNTYTYRQSELPEFRPEIRAEIAALDCRIGDLITKSCGNYHELEALSEVLDNCADSCELNLNSIRIIPVNSPLPEAGLKQIPSDVKELFFSTSLATSFLVQMLSQEMKVPNHSVEQMIAELVGNVVRTTPQERVDKIFDDLIEAAKKAEKTRDTVHKIEITIPK
jgi:hypothetical protein